MLVTSCASSGADPAGAGSGNARHTLTREQILDTQEPTLLEAVRRLRPNWLRARGPARSAMGLVTVAVYVNDVRRGGVASLRDIRPESVGSVEFIPATEANTRYGLQVAGGVISVRLVAGG